MSLEKLPINEPEQYDPNLEAQDEDVVSGGNNRLIYILAAVLLVFVLGYIALPKGHGSGISSVTPSFMLDDAAVTATASTGADSTAAGLKTAPAAVKAAEEDELKATNKVVPATTTTRPSAAMTTTAPVVAAVDASPVAVAATATAPEPAPSAAPAAAEPAAPASITLSGKIEDENGHPLVGATVLLKGSSKGTSTDANGNYSFEVPNGNENIFVYGYGGYIDEEVRGSGNKAVNVTLTPRPKTGRRRR